MGAASGLRSVVAGGRRTARHPCDHPVEGAAHPAADAVEERVVRAHGAHRELVAKLRAFEDVQRRRAHLRVLHHLRRERDEEAGGVAPLDPPLQGRTVDDVLDQPLEPVVLAGAVRCREEVRGDALDDVVLGARACERLRERAGEEPVDGALRLPGQEAGGLPHRVQRKPIEPDDHRPDARARPAAAPHPEGTTRAVHPGGMTTCAAAARRVPPMAAIRAIDTRGSSDRIAWRCTLRTWKSTGWTTSSPSTSTTALSSSASASRTTVSSGCRTWKVSSSSQSLSAPARTSWRRCCAPSRRGSPSVVSAAWTSSSTDAATRSARSLRSRFFPPSLRPPRVEP